MSKSLQYQVIARARAIVADPDHWIQGVFAAAKDYSPAEPTHPDAYRFCAVGALRRAASEVACAERYLGDHVQTALEKFIYGRHPELDDDLEVLNDDGRDSHQRVLQVFDEFLASLSE